MQLDPAQMEKRDIYFMMTRLITPRPIAWVSTLSASGVANLAPYSFFNGVGSKPPSVVFCPGNKPDGSPKDTIVITLGDEEITVAGLPLKAATGERTMTVKRK